MRYLDTDYFDDELWARADAQPDPDWYREDPRHRRASSIVEDMPQAANPATADLPF